ncbi:unnamed protein product [Pseudo-nitzschia multistriata]|uniref:Nudix hydrolase domain-containing protein n=1 Tax=Pseudo-nitzschia multistriata TaxID=183589 RepID=A0A448ZEI5_9STRA|nr:unnamed protein product [Pseudo-nitzschia multistriata]
MIPTRRVFMRMKRNKKLWSTAVAAAATTTTVLFCSPSSGDLSSRRCEQRLVSFASAFTPQNGPWGVATGSAAAMRVSSISKALSSAATSAGVFSSNVTECKESDAVEGQDDEESVVVTEIPFDESVLTYDHYNGVTINLEKYEENNDGRADDDSLNLSFATKLNNALSIWKAEGRKGIWIHTNSQSAKYIPDCVEAGFQFHKILPKKTSNDSSNPDEGNSSNALVLSRWLPTDTPSRLPHGPTHQVGVGVILLNPSDPSQMLVVKELSGPAAKYNLWKMPTGLVDPQEYVPEAASRELLEETGIEATMSSILCIRQAHRSNADTSDMFFVCKMTPSKEEIIWQRQEAEIAEIRWMPVKEYCQQDQWQGSPLYETLNDCVLKASLQEVERQQRNAEKVDTGKILNGIEHRQLEVGFGRTDGKSEALFLPEPQQLPSSTITTTGSKL